MAKINMPIGENGLLDYSGEAMVLNELILNPNRSTAGAAEFTSISSGITYNTNDYPDDPEIYDKGDYGMIRLLQKLYGGKDGWIVMAEDFIQVGENGLSWEDIGGKTEAYYKYSKDFVPLETVDPFMVDGSYLIKISDVPLSPEEMIGYTVVTSKAGTKISQRITEDIIGINEDYAGAFGFISVFKEDGLFLDRLSNGVWLSGDKEVPTYISEIYRGEVKTIDEKYLPEGAVNVNPDWHQSDVSFSNFIKNRPFYEDNFEASYNFYASGLPMISFDGFNYRWFKFSNLTPSKEQILKATIIENYEIQHVTEESFGLSSDAGMWFDTGSGSYFVAYDTGVFTILDEEVRITETGLYYGCSISGKMPDENEVRVQIQYTDFKAIDSKFLPKSVTSWNDLEDKPFYEERKVYYEYDEDVLPLDSIEIESGIFLHKISETPMSYDEMIGCAGEVSQNGQVFTGVVTEDMLHDMGTFIVAPDAGVYSVLVDTTIEGITLTTGLWVIYSETEAVHVQKIYKDIVVTIPEKFLPDIDALPDVTDVPDGKVMKVSGGKWTIGDDNALLNISTATALPDSGVALSAYTVYKVSDPLVPPYVFAPPHNGEWAHGIFTVGEGAQENDFITFASGGSYIGVIPNFKAGKTYEFDVLGNIWAFAEVIAQ